MTTTLRSCQAGLRSVGGLGVALLAACLSCERAPATRPGVPPATQPGVPARRFETGSGTPGQEFGWQRHYRLLLRSSAEGRGDLLLRDLSPGDAIYGDRGLPVDEKEAAQGRIIYRYTPGATRLEQLDLDAWNAATGEICNCKCQQAGAALEPFVVERAVTFKAQSIQTAGPHLFGAGASPSGRYIAIVSADGEMEGFIIAGGRFATGAHYQQIFRKADGTQVGRALPLPITSWGTDPTPCWSPDERFIVYVSEFEVCIVETDRDGR